MSEQLDHYLKLWNLSNPAPLTQTVTSHLYTVTFEGETAVLKLLTDYGYEEQAGAFALRHWNGHGAIYVFASDEKAQLLEYAPGIPLVSMVARGEDEAAALVIAEVANRLHSVTMTPPSGLYPLDRWFRELFKKAKADESEGIDSVYRRGAKVAAELLASPRDIRVLHGDIHHENIRHSSRGWLAFDPKGLVGERTYDLANTLCNPPSAPELVHNEQRLLTNAGILARETGIELPRIFAYVFAYTCLSASWSLNIDDQSAAEWALKVGEIVEPHVPASF